MKLIVYNSLVIIVAIISLTFATILGLYGQDISYYLNDHNQKFELMKALTTTTSLSIGLYIITPILVFKLLKLKKIYAISCIIIFAIVGFPISLFSFFVFAMWMG